MVRKQLTDLAVRARHWPAQDGRPVGRFGYLEVVDASDVLDNAVACVVSDVHAEGKTFAQDAQLKSLRLVEPSRNA